MANIDMEKIYKFRKYLETYLYNLETLTASLTESIYDIINNLIAINNMKAEIKCFNVDSTNKDSTSFLISFTKFITYDETKIFEDKIYEIVRNYILNNLNLVKFDEEEREEFLDFVNSRNICDTFIIGNTISIIL